MMARVSEGFKGLSTDKLGTLTKSNSHQAQLIWHDRIHSDPLMQWVRSMIFTCAKR